MISRLSFKNKIGQLHFQTLAPTFVVLSLFLTTFASLTWNISNRFANLQKELSASTEASRSLLEISRLRGDSKELLLLYRITKETKYLGEINEMEMQRNLQTTRLQREIQSIPATHFLVQSFISSEHQNSLLRTKILSGIGNDPKERQTEARLFDDYSTLYDINSARLTDLHSLIYTRLTESEEAMKHWLHQIPLVLMSFMALGVLLTVALVRFYRSRVLQPLTLLHSGLGAIASGRLGELLPVRASATEIKEMIQDFNLMTLKLQQTTLSLKSAEENARQAANAKSEFLANMSHEIRTPLNVIVGLADVIQQRLLDEATRQDILILNKSSHLLLNIVNDILDYSRLESGQVQILKEPFHLVEKIQDVASIIRPLALAKDIHLQVDIEADVPQRIVGDSQLFEQALLNLANNAVKFTSKGSVTITAQKDETANGPWLKFSVEDSGIGILADKLDRLFNRFAQADSSITRTHGGTGLGLAIVKQIADLYDGEVNAQSVYGQGSTFTLRIPYEIASESSVQAMPEKIAEKAILQFSRKTKILLADDSEDNRYLVRTYLNDTGAEITEAQNGKEALAAFSRSQFDVVLMDVQMPEMDGYQATKEIRRLEKGTSRSRTPVIALTAFAMKEEVERSLNNGCDSHMTKPIQRKKLMQAIESFL